MTKNLHGNVCFLGLGSNLNDPIKQLKKSIQHLNKLPQTTVIEISNFYRSKAWGVTEQNDFINTVVKINTALRPKLLLNKVKKIEYQLMQRQINKRWHSRVIDIDLLIWGNITMNRADLVLPHPWISERCFVIQPLLELKPKLPAYLLKQITKHQLKHSCLSQLTSVKKPQMAGLTFK